LELLVALLEIRLPWMLIKGETPVIYCYTPRPVQVRVGVGFPQGIWTQWFVRVMVDRLELLSCEREQLAEAAIRDPDLGCDHRPPDPDA
jgi:hypothetical protein